MAIDVIDFGDYTKLDASGVAVDSAGTLLSNSLLKVYFATTSVTIQAGAKLNQAVSVPASILLTAKAVLLCQTPNAAYVSGAISTWSGGTVTVGLANNATSSVSGTLSVVVLYT